MATEKLQIVLDAAWRGKSAVQQANSDVNKLDDSVAKTGAGFQKLAIGAGVAVAGFTALAGAAKIAWGVLEEGAALARSRDQFERLTASIGSTADVMLGKLKDATGGMVSDAELIAGAGQIMSLGLADTEDGVVRLATLTAKLGWDMQQVILTFANNSKMRLDALGLSVTDVDAKMKALQATGMSMDAAFDMAVIEAGEEKVLLLGDAALTTEGKMKILQTAWENANNVFKESVVDEVAKEFITATDAAAGLEDSIIQMAQGAGEAIGGVIANVIALSEALLTAQALATGDWGNVDPGVIKAMLGGMGKAAVMSGPAGLIIQGHMNAYNSALEAVHPEQFTTQSSDINTSDAMKEQSTATDENTESVEENISAVSTSFKLSRDFTMILGGMTKAQYQAGAAHRDSAKVLGQGAGVIKDVFRLTRDFTTILPGMTAAQYAAGAAIRDTNRAIGQQVVLIQGLHGPVQAAGVQYQYMTDAQREGISATQDLTGSLGGVGMAAESAADKMARLAAETGAFFDQARRGDDFDPAEAFYKAALKHGASAEQLRDLLVRTGLESPERSQEIYEESIQRQLADLAGQAYAGGENLDMLWQGVQSGMANPAWAKEVVQNVTNTTNLGGISVNVTVNGNIGGDDLKMTVDSAIKTAVVEFGGDME